jgi:uncharacterized MAPEG superfamily protein
MTIAYWTILVAILMPWVLAIIAKIPVAWRGSYDNNNPRILLASLKGRSQRANWAQQNSFEILPAYAAAVIVAHLAGAQQNFVDSLAVLFIVSRVLYAICYIQDWATLRSLVWAIGLACIAGLFVVSV